MRMVLERSPSEPEPRQTRQCRPQWQVRRLRLHNASRLPLAAVNYANMHHLWINSGASQEAPRKVMEQLMELVSDPLRKAILPGRQGAERERGGGEHGARHCPGHRVGGVGAEFGKAEQW